MRALVSALLLLPTVSAWPSSGVSPDDAVLYSKLSGAGFRAPFNTPEAKKNLEQAVKIYGQDGDLWWRLGQARLAAKEYDPSIEAYQKALELGAFGNKFKAGAQYDIACAYALKGEKDRAFDWLNRSLASGFRDLQHVRTDTDLDSLHTDKRWEEIAATKDVSKMSRDAAWRYDLWLLHREVSRIHFNPNSRFTKAEQDAWVKKLHDSIPKMDDDEIKVAFMKYTRRLNDGHTGIRPAQAQAFKALPLQLYWFQEGIHVVAADPKLKELVGLKVIKVAGKPVDEVVAKVDDVVQQDNSQGLRAIAPRYLTIPALLHGLGVMPSKDAIDLVLVDTVGKERMVTVEAVQSFDISKAAAVRDTSVAASPLYFKYREKPYWFEHLPEFKAVYFQYNSVRNDPAETTEKFTERLLEFIEKNDVQRLIVDVRWNGGGNSFLNRPIVNGIIGCRKINKPGSLFVITGRQTFSAAQNFTTDLERALDPIFVGEPTGSSPNFVGETVRFALPHSKMEGSISDLYWQRSWPMDHRTWIAPDLPAPPSIDLFRANRDPAMEAILAYLKG
jgi:tetratricopeptide (TPR) repeat protein